MIDDPLYIAVDLGAGSGRVFLAGVAREEFTLEEVSRFAYPARQSDGHLRWDFPGIFEEIKAGLIAVGTSARRTGPAIQSIGVDSWGVDYGLIDSAGNLIEDPVCYRDHRTHGMMEQVFARVSREQIFDRTGIQFLPFNTLFQLYAYSQAGVAEEAARLLMIPDLVNFFLTGQAVTEYTNASTTQMLNALTKTWDRELLDELGLPSKLLAGLVTAGTDLGPLKPELAGDLSLGSARVIAPATHDTASAVAGTPLESGWAYISSGTWSLVGIEIDSPLINADVQHHNFTNEGGVFGTTRFLKNVMGLWILESCRREWKDRGIVADYQSLLAEAASTDGCAVIFPDDERFFNPPCMLDAVCEQLIENDLRINISSPAFIAKTILDSLALRYASVLRTIERLTDRTIEGVHIVGGGSRNDYLNQATATATGLPVRAGPVEATVVGNVLVQAITSGCFQTLVEARRYVSEHTQLRMYEPKPSRAWDEAAERYARIEERYVR